MFTSIPPSVVSLLRTPMNTSLTNSSINRSLVYQALAKPSVSISITQSRNSSGAEHLTLLPVITITILVLLFREVLHLHPLLVVSHQVLEASTVPQHSLPSHQRLFSMELTDSLSVTLPTSPVTRFGMFTVVLVLLQTTIPLLFTALLFALRSTSPAARATFLVSTLPS
jgi:hypothetical protein